jgi:hypothetical protein
MLYRLVRDPQATFQARTGATRAAGNDGRLHRDMTFGHVWLGTPPYRSERAGFCFATCNWTVLERIDQALGARADHGPPHSHGGHTTGLKQAYDGGSIARGAAWAQSRLP